MSKNPTYCKKFVGDWEKSGRVKKQANKKVGDEQKTVTAEKQPGKKNHLLVAMMTWEKSWYPFLFSVYET